MARVFGNFFHSLTGGLWRLCRFGSGDFPTDVIAVEEIDTAAIPFTLGDLPQDCLTAVVSHFSFQNLSCLAMVNKSFHSAVKSVVLMKIQKLPTTFTYGLPLLQEGRIIVEKVFNLYGRGNLLQGGRQHVQIDPETELMKLSTSVVESMEVVWGDDSRYWDLQTYFMGSPFAKSARLRDVCWFNVGGEFTCTLSPGRYRVSWRIIREKGAYWVSGPPRSYITVDNICQETTVDLVNDLSYEWHEFPVGEILAKEGPGDCPGECTLVVKAELRETEGSWKSGYIFDSINLTQLPNSPP